MAALTKYGFIVQGSGYVVGKDMAVFDSGRFHTTIMAVASMDDARIAARQLVEQGVEVIELCGAFTQDDKNAIAASIHGAVPIGHVVFSGPDEEKLKVFLAS